MIGRLSVLLMAMIFWQSSLACRLRHRTMLLELKESEYAHNRQVRLREIERQRKLNLALWQDLTSKTPHIWYLAQPTYACEHAARIGDVLGDGAKFVCNLHHVKQQDSCLYYGIGVDGEVYFEEAFVPMTADKPCEMHAFDPVDGVTKGSMPQHLKDMGIHFHPWGLNDVDGEFDIGWSTHQGYSLATIKQKLGHVGRMIDILKMDIEGSEWRVLASLLSECDRAAPFAHQLLIEFHSPHYQNLMNMLDKLDSCGYRVFYTDFNLYCLHCVELALVHENFLKCH